MDVLPWLKIEGAKYSININAIAPGYMATDNASALRADPVRSASILERIPAGRWGRTERLRMVFFLYIDKSKLFMKGCVLWNTGD